MEEVVNMGILSIVPALLAIVLSFVTKNTIVALATACIVGTLLAGQRIFGFPTLLENSLGNTDFSWVMLLNTFIYWYSGGLLSEDRGDPGLFPVGA